MKLRGKTVLILITASLLVCFILYQLFNSILLGNFKDMEQAHMTQDITRGIAAVNDELASLDIIVVDWAVWDESYQFMRGNYPHYVETNLYDSVYSSLNLYSLLLINPSGRVAAGGMCDAEGNVSYSIPQSLMKHLQKSGLILSRSEDGMPVKGLLQTKEGPLLFSAHPIIAASSLTDSVGTLFMARRLDETLIKQFKKTTSLELSFLPFTNTSSPPANQIQADIFGLRRNIHLTPLDENHICGDTTLTDIYGQPALIMQITTPRDIYQQGILTRNYLSVALAGMTLFLILLVYVLFGRLILSRFETLNASINTIGRIRYFSIRIPVTGKDEIAALSQNTNQMLSQLELAQQQLTASKQQYQKLFDDALSANYICTSEGKLTLCNPTFLNLLGYNRFEEILHSTCWEIYINPVNKSEFTEILYRQGRIENSERVICNRSGKKITVLENIVGVFDKQNKLTYIQGYMLDISQRKEAEEAIRYLSYHDKLTGLYNRLYFEEKLLRLDHPIYLPLSVIVIDVNGLKLVNDVLGHFKGDELLIQVAAAIKNCCRKEDVACRWGGDEYMVLLPATKASTANQICDRIKTCCENVVIQGLQVSASLGVMTKEHNNQDINEVLRLAEEKMYRNKLLQHTSNRNVVIRSLEKSLQSRSDETELHTQRLIQAVVQMGQYLRLSQSDLDELVLLAALHDIGKIAIPDYILNKPSALTDGEWVIMKKHSESGYRIAQSSPEMASVADTILYHHERWDGKGYPLGLQGRDIPLPSRILAIVDAYDVMTNGRPYKEKISSEMAIAELKRCAGTQFDPELVEAFIASLMNKPSQNCNETA